MLTDGDWGISWEFANEMQGGHVFKSAEKDNMFALFSRHSGPIAAALAITVEQFND